MLRSFHHGEFPAERLAAAKRGRRISVCLPARNEADTVGLVVASIRTTLMEQLSLVDELVVIDDSSSDGTAAAARSAGADVVAAADVLKDPARVPGAGDVHHGGKGQAMWKGVHVTTGDLIAFCDADIRNFAPQFVTGLLGPLLTRDDLVFVKGYYLRPLEGQAGQGGRVTELVARPLISMLFPHLGPLIQPLAGECAARRQVLEQVPFVDGYGVDLGLLIDVSERFGLGSIGQCDLGERVHRNRPLSELGPQAMAIVQLALSRAGMAPGSAMPWASCLVRPGEEPVTVSLSERPPLSEVPAHRKTA